MSTPSIPSMSSTQDSSASRVADLLSHAVADDDLHREIRRREAELQLRILKKLDAFCPEEGDPADGFLQLMRGYCAIRRAAASARRADVYAAATLHRLTCPKPAPGRSSKPFDDDAPWGTKEDGTPYTEQEFQTSLRQCLLEVYGLDTSQSPEYGKSHPHPDLDPCTSPRHSPTNSATPDDASIDPDTANESDDPPDTDDPSGSAADSTALADDNESPSSSQDPIPARRDTQHSELRTQDSAPTPARPELPSWKDLKPHNPWVDY